MKEHWLWIINQLRGEYVQCENRHYTSAVRSFQCQKEAGHFGRCVDSLGRTLIPNSEPKPKKPKLKAV